MIGARLIAGSAWGGEQEMLTQRATRLLATRCGSCHGAGRTSGLDLRTREARLRGGARGPVIVPGDPDRSLLLRFVTGREGDVHGEVIRPVLA